MKVSVIVPIYNQEKHLNRCVDSLINQNFNDYEIILVNDGSTDKTPLICDEYSQKYDFIKTIHKSNSGVSATRNVGINAAQGEYIMFVDSDDYVAQNYISDMYQCQIENPDHLVVCDMFRNLGHSSKFKRTLPHNIKDKISYSKDEFYLLYKFHISGFPVNKIFERQRLLSSNICFDPSLALGEDAVFVIQYFQTCKGFTILPTPLYYYCLLDSGATLKYRKDRFNQIAPSFFLRIPLIKDEYLPQYCDSFLWDFVLCLKNTFDKRNPDGFYKKIKYNNSILRSKEFVFCLENASKKNESPKYIKLLQKKNYLWIYLTEKISKLVKR